MADQTSEKTRQASGDRADDTARDVGALPLERTRGRDDRPAFVTFLAGIVLVAVLLWQGGLLDFWFGPADDTVAATLTAPLEGSIIDAVRASGESQAPAEPAPQATGVDVDGLQAALEAGGAGGVTLTESDGELVASGEVPDEEVRQAILAFLGSQPGVSSVIDEMVIGDAAPAVAASSVQIEASQATIVLAGTVPSQELADAMQAQAVAIYSADQIDNQLIVDPAVEPPVTVSVSGSVTDPVLFDAVTQGFAGIEGIDAVATDGFVLAESSELETSLNDLAPIEFASGSSVILDESLAIVDEAASFLNANPDVVVEIGGHTDSVGDDGPNQVLSQARADAVVEALRAREVTNELEPRGFGESRLKVEPDDTAEAQQTNRRIEFRIL